MTTRRVAALLLAMVPAAAQQQRQSASIKGTVVNAATGEGLRKAFVIQPRCDTQGPDERNLQRPARERRGQL